MIIDADGLFNGARWRKCSNAARLNAPYLLLASNGYGRLEIDPVRIVARAYASFDPRPSGLDILGWIQEYEAANLLFLYDAAGQMWGVWDTPDRLLAKYKSAADKRSPEPPEPAFSEWRSRYRVESKTVTTFPKSFENVSENFSENSPSGIGFGLGEGIGKGKNTCASDEAHLADSSSFLLSEEKPSPRPDPREVWFETFWSEYRPIRSRARKDARKAFMASIKNEAILAGVMSGLRAQAQEFLSRDPEKRPYAASWLRGERWQDETVEVESTRQTESISPIDRAVETAFEE